MKLYFLRHADAVDGADDDARALSTLGKRQSRAVGKFLKRAGIQCEVCFSSPLVRSVQTAELVLKAAGVKQKVKLAAALRNGTSKGEFSRWLQGLPTCESVLLVGHAPSLAQRVSALLGIRDLETIKLSKAGLACVETDDCRRAVLKFLIPPKLLMSE